MKNAALKFINEIKYDNIKIKIGMLVNIKNLLRRFGEISIADIFFDLPMSIHW